MIVWQLTLHCLCFLYWTGAASVYRFLLELIDHRFKLIEPIWLCNILCLWSLETEHPLIILGKGCQWFLRVSDFRRCLETGFWMIVTHVNDISCILVWIKASFRFSKSGIVRFVSIRIRLSDVLVYMDAKFELFLNSSGFWKCLLWIFVRFWQTQIYSLFDFRLRLLLALLFWELIFICLLCSLWEFFQITSIKRSSLFWTTSPLPACTWPGRKDRLHIALPTRCAIILLESTIRCNLARLRTEPLTCLKTLACPCSYSMRRVLTSRVARRFAVKTSFMRTPPLFARIPRIWHRSIAQ